eukprot:59835-Prorocentrum_minimum.AAC.2
MYNYVPHSGKERSVRDSEDSAGLGFISKCEYQDEEYEEYEEEVEDVVEDAAGTVWLPSACLTGLYIDLCFMLCAFKLPSACQAPSSFPNLLQEITLIRYAPFICFLGPLHQQLNCWRRCNARDSPYRGSGYPRQILHSSSDSATRQRLF